MPGFSELLKLETQPKSKRAVLVDGHSLAYRSFYAIRELTTSSGLPVNAVFGFWLGLTKLLREYPSAYVTVTFDAGGKNFRHRLYPEYKATRDPMPDELAVQLSLIEKMIKSLGIHVVSRRGVEADDIIATIARKAEAAGIDVVIASSDKDLAQLVNNKIRLLRPARGKRRQDELLDSASVRKRFGVGPESIVDYLSLVGDTSDNIPGVPQVGKKRAAKLLNQYGSLDKVLESAQNVRNKGVRENLEQYAENARFARTLVLLKDDIDVGDIPRDCVAGDVDKKQLAELFSELEFKSLLGELGLGDETGNTENDEMGEPTYNTVTTYDELEKLVEEIAGKEYFSLDLETTSKDSTRAKIVGVAVSVSPYEGYYIPVGHDYLGVPTQLDCSEVLEKLRSSIETDSVGIIGQNLKYDVTILQRYGLKPVGICFDAMIASHLCEPDKRHHNLEAIAERNLNYKMVSYKEVAGSEGSFAAVELKKATRYAAEDAEIVIRVKSLLDSALEKVDAKKLFDEVEIPLVPVLARMEQNGILLDGNILAAQGEEIGDQLQIIKEDLFEMAGEEFNPNSPKQVGEILFEKLELPVIERTKTGPSTNARVLVELAQQHALPGKLNEYRGLEKLMNTYIRRLPGAVNPETGRIHTSFHQTATATGRLSSSDPNLQNIPIRSEVGERIRKAFVAPEGYVLLGADYSQIELRLLAHLSKDEKLIDAFVSGQDLHRLTASNVFSVPVDEVEDRQRYAAKRINFGMIYGMSAYGLARELSVSRAEAKSYIDRFFSAYPQAKAYIDRMVEVAKQRGYAETMLGRRRPLPGLSSANYNRRSYAKRNAVNTPIQGSAADLIKLAMLKVSCLIEDGALPARMLLQIHDELIFEVEEKYGQTLAEAVGNAMEDVYSLEVPLKVDVKIGRNWGEL